MENTNNFYEDIEVEEQNPAIYGENCDSFENYHDIPDNFILSEN
jgi:hypothetical protein